MDPKTRKRVIAHLLQFFIIGLVMGISEDLLAIYFATDAKISWHIFKVASIVAFPFAVISELVVDVKVFKKMIDNSSSNSKIAKK